MQLWHSIGLTALGVIVTGFLGLVGALMIRGLKTLSDIPQQLKTIAEQNAAQSKNVEMLVKVQRPIIRSLRSHSYALRECGANGSVTKALEHIGTAEDLLNGRCEAATIDIMGGH
jgi:hypothetical protein